MTHQESEDAQREVYGRVQPPVFNDLHETFDAPGWGAYGQASALPPVGPTAHSMGGAGEPPKKRHTGRWVLGILVLVGLLVFAVAALIGAAADSVSNNVSAGVSPSVVEPSMPPLPSEQKEANKKASAPAAPTAAKPAAPSLTTAQANAARSARSYLTVSGFSQRGLIEQLVQFDGYSLNDATKAVGSLHVSWKDEAVRTGRAYLDISGFSRSGLIDQLEEFDKYTHAQAVYAANKLGL